MPQFSISRLPVFFVGLIFVLNLLQPRFHWFAKIHSRAQIRLLPRSYVRGRKCSPVESPGTRPREHPPLQAGAQLGMVCHIRNSGFPHSKTSSFFPFCPPLPASPWVRAYGPGGVAPSPALQPGSMSCMPGYTAGLRLLGCHPAGLAASGNGSLKPAGE